MPSIEKLTVLVIGGETSRLISGWFNGERRFHQPRFEDQELYVIFPQEVPSIEALAQVVLWHYSARGYTVERGVGQHPDIYDAFIYPSGDKARGMIALSITRQCEMPDPNDHSPNIKISTQILAPQVPAR